MLKGVAISKAQKSQCDQTVGNDSYQDVMAHSAVRLVRPSLQAGRAYEIIRMGYIITTYRLNHRVRSTIYTLYSTVDTTMKQLEELSQAVHINQSINQLIT